MALLWVCFTGGEYHPHSSCLSSLSNLCPSPRTAPGMREGNWSTRGCRENGVCAQPHWSPGGVVIAAGAAVGISTVQAPFSCAALCQVKPFLFQTFTQLLTWLANRESTCNLTLSLVQVITGCFFFTWMNVIIKFLTVTLYFSVKLGSKQRRSSINSNGCRKTQTHMWLKAPRFLQNTGLKQLT